MNTENRSKLQHRILSGKTLSVLVVTSVILCLSGCGKAPTFREFSEPELTQWQPEGNRYASQTNNIIGKRFAFKTIHGDTLNSDEVTLAYAPMFERGWISESDFFIPEGPTFDDAGNLYFSPLMPHEDVALVSIAPDTGARRWAIVGEYPGVGGAPLVLENPSRPGDQIVYSGGYEKLIAVQTDGTLLWETQTGLNQNDADRTAPHHFGVNYHPQTDSLIAAMSDGHLVILDRATGNLRMPAFRLPGMPSVENEFSKLLPDFVAKKVDAMLAPLLDFGESGSFSQFLNILLGGGSINANYFSVDPNTGNIWVASTAPDEADGNLDSISELGALYGLQLTESNDNFIITSSCSYYIEGGSASTPALTADGNRIYFGDSQGNLLALDTACQEVWRMDIGDQIVGSVGVSSDNNELYVATADTVYQVIDQGTSAQINWEADISSAFNPLGVGMHAMNLNLAGIGANGVMINVGAGYRIQGTGFPVIFGIALLDRETGKVRYAAQGAEETVSVMATGPDGAIYLAHSPVRHSIIKAILPNKTTSIVGGIGKYQPIRHDLLMVEAVCAAKDRLANRIEHLQSSNDMEIVADLNQVEDLIRQARQAGLQAHAAGLMDSTEWQHYDVSIKEAMGLARIDQQNALRVLLEICR